MNTFCCERIAAEHIERVTNSLFTQENVSSLLFLLINVDDRHSVLFSVVIWFTCWWNVYIEREYFKYIKQDF